MRKSILSLIMLCVAFVMNAEAIAPPLIESFDGADFPPSGWTQQQFVGTQNWTKSSNPTMYIGKGSAYAMISAVSQTALVSPDVALPATGNFNLKFFTKFMFLDPNASFEVWISADGRDDAKNFKVLKTLHGDKEVSDKEWKEISVGIPSDYNGKTVCIAFVTSTETAGFYAWAVDEVELTELVDDPVFYGENALTGATAYANLPFPSVTGYEIKNKGGAPLTIDSQVAATSGLRLANLPLTIQPGQAGILNVELDAYGASLPVGPYNGSFTLGCNDPKRTQVTVSFTANVDSKPVSRYLNESFEYSTGLPEEWVLEPASGVYAFSVKAGRGVDGGNALNAILVNNFKTVTVRTGFVDMGSAPRIGFAYRLTDRLSGEDTSADKASMTVRISDDGGFTWNTVYRMEPGDHTPSMDFTAKDIDLSAFAGKVCMAEITFNHEAIGADFNVDLDNISLGSAPANDLAAVSLKGNSLPSENVPTTYSVTVLNNGKELQQGTSWSVGLYNDRDEKVATASGVDIKPGETQDVSLTYSFNGASRQTIYAKVESSADENPDNNTSPALKIYVQGADITALSIGDSSVTGVSPVNFTQATSLSQSLYLPEEIGCDAALINGIVYRTKLTSSHQAEPIKVWMGETDKTDYSDYQRVNPSDLTLVFDGTVDFSGVDGDAAVISLDTPFHYNGKTLVTYVFRPSAQAYSQDDCFYGFNAEKSRTFVTGYVFSEINPMDQYTYMEMSNTVPDLTILTTSQYGAIAGVVSDKNGPVADATVRVAGSHLTAMTDAEGKYSFGHLTAGQHTLEVSKNGYLDASAQFNVTAQETVSGDMTISEIVGFPLEGTVTDRTTGNPVSGATVVIKGYANYKAVSDASGRYDFPDVYTGEYDIMVSAGGFGYWTSKVNVTEKTTFDIELVETPYPVTEVAVDINGGNVTVSWNKPEHIDSFRYDSGQADSETGFGNGLEYGVFGSAYKEKSTLTSMSWYLTGRGGDQDKVNVYVFALDGNGLPTSRLLYSAMDVPTITNGWSSHTFATPVEAPEGFYVAVGRKSGFLSLGVSRPTEEYPLVPKTQFYSGDYNSGRFIATEDPAVDGTPGQSVNYMVRAQGISGGKNIYLAPAAEAVEPRVPQPEKYTVYRLEDGMPESEWEKLAELTDLAYSDNWNALADGKIYRYAVKAVYPGDNVSEATVSTSLPKGMEVEYIVNLSTNTGDSPKDSELILTNADNDPAHIYTVTATDGTVTFPAVWRGVYDLTISKSGYDMLYVNDIHIEAPDLNGSYTLMETIKNPYNLKVKVDGTDAVLSWNNASESFFDDMEGHDDFIIDGIGDYLLFDGDRQPSYWFNDIYFDNMGYVGSWIVMNPSHTSPASNSKTFMPYSGEKYLACMSTRTDTPNNDWLILPKVKVNNGSILKFQAQNFTVGYDIARFKVGVSVSGTAPEDFHIISEGEYQEAPYSGAGVKESWEEVSFDLSEFVGKEVYIAIACVSDDKTSILMIDDIEVVAGEDTALIDKLPENEENVTYTVYVDGSEMAKGIKGKEHLLSGLASGTHTAGVKAVYRTGESEIVTADFTVEDSGVMEVTGSILTVGFDGEGFLRIDTQSEVKAVMVFDMQGQCLYTEQGNIRKADMRHLPAGVYTVRIALTDNVRSFKLYKR